jgi:hypothetical protein
MNLQKYYKILDIPDDTELTPDILKKKYRLHALRYHPDRNKEDDANERFLEIQEAYDKINQYVYDNDSDIEIDSDDENIANEGYHGLLFSFIKNVVRNTSNNIQTSLYDYIFQKISTLCEEQSIRLLEKLDKNVLLEIHRIIGTYRDVFNYADNFIDKIENILRNKMSNDECIILHPLLDDLLDQNVYKLVIGDNIFMVPLWHHELVYDNSGCDLYVKCIPILPDNITIDENNRLTIKKGFNIGEIFDKEEIEFEFGKKTIAIQVKNLHLKKKQIILYADDGIPQINTTEIYNVDSIAGVYLEVELYI